MKVAWGFREVRVRVVKVALAGKERIELAERGKTRWFPKSWR